MGNRSILLVLLLSLFFSHAKTQVVEVLDYPAFEQRLERDNDTVYIYNFWATWCKPCIVELPYFRQLNKDYRSKKIKVEFVSLDLRRQLESLVIPASKKRLDGEKVILLDAPKYNEWMGKISEDWGGAIPATLIAAKAKRIYAFKEQSFTYEELSAWIDEVLADD